MNELTVGVSLGHYLALGAVLFCISVAGIFLNRKNVIVLLMSIELMLLAVNINFVGFSRHLGDPSGQEVVTWQVALNNTQEFLSRRNPRQGDALTVSTKKPFLAQDVFEFEVTPASAAPGTWASR